MSEKDPPSVWNELFAKARNGDEDARNRIFEACRAYMHVVARVQIGSRLRTKADASDVVQQSLLDAYRGFDQFRGSTEAEWLAWLKQIVRHRTLDCVRRYATTAKRGGAGETPLDAADSRGDGARIDLADAEPTPSRIFMNQENELLLAEAISALPEDYREVIILRNLEHLPFADIAARMDRSRGAVQMLWMRAVDELRGRLQDRVDLP